MIAGSANPDTVIAALAGKSSPNICVRNSVIRVVYRASIRKTVIVTMSLSVDFASVSVFSIFRNVWRHWASKSPANDFPLSSLAPVWPAIHIVRPGLSVMTAGENARCFCQLPRMKDFSKYSSSRSMHGPGQLSWAFADNAIVALRKAVISQKALRHRAASWLPVRPTDQRAARATPFSPRN
jgi:hypothetical protein